MEVSPAAKSFVLLMLERNPNKRGDLEKCLCHRFFANA